MLQFVNTIKRQLLTVLLVFGFAWFGAGIVRAGELTPLHPGYPEVFDQEGVLQNIQDDLMVVSDSTLQLLPSTVFQTPNGSVGKDGIPMGYLVGVMLNEDTSVKSVWMIEAGDSGMNQEQKEENRDSGTDSPLRLENGVWTN